MPPKNACLLLRCRRSASVRRHAVRASRTDRRGSGGRLRRNRLRAAPPAEQIVPRRLAPVNSRRVRGRASDPALTLQTLERPCP
jgi:hypothetical protein